MAVPRRWFAAALAVVLLLRPVAAAAPPAPAKPRGPPIQRLIWTSPHRIDWQLGVTPQWFSLGHTNRVVAFLPHGVAEANGQVTATTDGSGAVFAIDLEVHEVTAFDPATGLPQTTRRLARETISADDPQARTRQRWRFPTEQGYDWELKLLPPSEHQTLFRMFLHDDPWFWYTLMVHTEAELAPLTEPLAAAAKAKSAFRDLRCHIIVMELLHDPALPLTSKYIEPDDPPSTWWIEQQAVKAPWALDRNVLAPANGSVEIGADGSCRFQALSARARQAAGAIKQRTAQQREPQPTTPGGDDGNLPSGDLDEH